MFRSTILAASLLGGLSTRALVFGTPLWFGIAHAHHALEVWRQGGKTTQAAIQASAGCGEFLLIELTTGRFGIGSGSGIGQNDGDAERVLIIVFQLSYTTLFGWYASYLFLRTGSVIPPLLSHVFCNIMGIYLPSSATARHPSRKLRELFGSLHVLADCSYLGRLSDWYCDFRTRS